MFDAPLSSRGRNAKVFLARTRDRAERVVAKISRAIDFSVRHEHAVLTSLAALGSPHFPRVCGLADALVDCNYRRKLNPFDMTPGLPPIRAEILLMEYIEGGVDLDKFASAHATSPAVFALVRQVMLAVLDAQERVQFTHYDLHPANVLVRPTELRTLEYAVRGVKYTVPTHGYIATIIDFGLSYTRDLVYMYTPLFHTEIGVLSDRFRPSVDFKQLLVGLHNDIDNKKLERFVDKMYGKLKIDWAHGWDTPTGYNAVDELYAELYDRHTSVSRMFSEYGYACFALVHSLCRLPLNVCPADKLARRRGHVAYAVLEREFAKLEDEIGCPLYNMYILRRMVDAARALYGAYIDDDTRLGAVLEFKRGVFAVVDSVAALVQLKDVSWERLLCALYALAAYMSSKMAETVSAQEVAYKIPAKSDTALYTRFCEEVCK